MKLHYAQKLSFIVLVGFFLTFFPFQTVQAETITTTETWTTNRSLTEDIVIASGGHLTIEAGVVVTASCSDGYNLGYDGERVEIFIEPGGRLTVNGATFQGDGSAGCWGGIIIWSEDSLTDIQDSTIRDVDRGIYIIDSSPTIEGNEITNIRGDDGSNSGAAGELAVGIQISSRSLSARPVIMTNHIHGITGGSGIAGADGADGGSPGESGADGGQGGDGVAGGDGGYSYLIELSMQSADIYNNTLADVVAAEGVGTSSSGMAGGVGGLGGEGLTDGTDGSDGGSGGVVGFSVSGRAYGIYQYKASGLTSVYNNILFLSDGLPENTYALYETSTVFETLDYNVIYGWFSTYTTTENGPHSILADPLFVSAMDHDLKFGSPCLDSGTDTGAPSDDINGDSRPFDANGDEVAIVDIGAFERQFSTIFFFLPIILK